MNILTAHFLSFVLCLWPRFDWRLIDWLISRQSQSVLDWMLLEICIKAPSVMRYEVKKSLHLLMNWNRLSSLLSFLQLRGGEGRISEQIYHSYISTATNFSLVNDSFLCKKHPFFFLWTLANALFDLTVFQLILVQVGEYMFVTKDGQSK